MTEEKEDRKKVAIPIEGEEKKKKKWYWGCGGCGCLGFILIVLIGGCVALFGGTDEDDSDKKVDNKVVNVKEEEKDKAKKEQEEKEKAEQAKKEQEEKDKAEQSKKEQEEKEKAQQDKKEADQAKTEKACLNIKGNTSSSGEKIYHVPGGQFYDKTNPEQTFCTEGEAKSAGYRESKR